MQWNSLPRDHVEYANPIWDCCWLGLPLLYFDHSCFIFNHDIIFSVGGKSLKPNYEKPVAVTLGEAAKGSGECNTGSGVGVGSTYCNVGNYPYNCYPGGVAQGSCSQGNQTYRTCYPGLTPDRCCRNDPDCFNQ
jgi:hypothetical protein